MSARWLARAAFLLVLAAVADMIGFADLRSLAMLAAGAVGECLVLAGGHLFLAHRGALRWLALAVVVLALVTVLVIFTLHGLLWEALVAVALITLAADAGRHAAPVIEEAIRRTGETVPDAAWVLSYPGHPPGRQRSGTRVRRPGQPSFTAVPEALTISMLLPTDS
jgi:hypothetical protein